MRKISLIYITVEVTLHGIFEQRIIIPTMKYIMILYDLRSND